jgi:hypothetical protein
MIFPSTSKCRHINLIEVSQVQTQSRLQEHMDAQMVELYKFKLEVYRLHALVYVYPRSHLHQSNHLVLITLMQGVMSYYREDGLSTSSRE